MCHIQVILLISFAHHHQRVGLHFHFHTFRNTQLTSVSLPPPPNPTRPSHTNEHSIRHFNLFLHTYLHNLPRSTYPCLTNSPLSPSYLHHSHFSTLPFPHRLRTMASIPYRMFCCARKFRSWLSNYWLNIPKFRSPHIITSSSSSVTALVPPCF